MLLRSSMDQLVPFEAISALGTSSFSSVSSLKIFSDRFGMPWYTAEVVRSLLLHFPLSIFYPGPPAFDKISLPSRANLSPRSRTLSLRALASTPLCLSGPISASPRALSTSSKGMEGGFFSSSLDIHSSTPWSPKSRSEFAMKLVSTSTTLTAPNTAIIRCVKSSQFSGAHFYKSNQTSLCRPTCRPTLSLWAVRTSLDVRRLSLSLGFAHVSRRAPPLSLSLGCARISRCAPPHSLSGLCAHLSMCAASLSLGFAHVSRRAPPFSLSLAAPPPSLSGLRVRLSTCAASLSLGCARISRCAPPPSLWAVRASLDVRRPTLSLGCAHISRCAPPLSL
ncbi:hypothetical protein C8F04DRAFT_652694 [Mycena alexandri]|uniref:Uncharacterized protein n=1 Tax=Mycena alexandri TaxID=1745969 RepID=A0AAD6SVD0_9AGAR|nr:hypothetical protein C8F04DRAFT_652694 [Mycena alexandri]